MFQKVNVATGLYCNWDYFFKVDDRVLDWIRSLKKVKPKGVILSSLEEAVYSLDKALKEGGREFLISEEVYSDLISQFKPVEKRLGGNGFHMGRALHALGLRPLVSYPSRAPSIMTASPNFKVACKEGLKSPEESARDGDKEYVHLIFEFKRDSSKGVQVSGRHILSWDLMSSQGILDYDFLNYASSSNVTDILILGYAHLLLPKYKKKTDIIVDYLDNPSRPRVHLEFGQGSSKSMKYAMKKFADQDCSDSWGLNEKECESYLGAESERVEDLKEAVFNAIKEYGLIRICVHTPEFVFSISKYHSSKEFDSLLSGCLTSTALTLGEGIKRNIGRAKALPTFEIKKKHEKINGYNFCLLPSFINPRPKILTGLGDAFSASQAVKALI